MTGTDATEAGRTLRIGTRGSALAVTQARMVADALAAAGTSCTIETIVTAGDRRAPDTAWGEGAFVGAIESALLDGRVDVAVHSAKDVPTEENPALRIAAYLPREDPRDVIVVPSGAPVPRTLADLPHDARIGTDSPRRTAFLCAARADLDLRPIHGNVDTRLRRLDAREADALVLAAAGLRRLGREDRIAFALDPAIVPPAPGQGALAIQVRSDDALALDAVAALDDRVTRIAVEAERAVLRASGGGCRTPLGALATVEGDQLALTAGYAQSRGALAAVATLDGPATDGSRLAQEMIAALVERLAVQARELGAPRVIVTKIRAHAVPTMLALIDRGLAPISVPAIAVEPTADPRLDDLVRELHAFGWVVLTSRNAVAALADAAHRAGLCLPSAGSDGPRWAAVGRQTAAALELLGLRVAVCPAEATGAALAEAIPIELGDRVLLPRGDLADTTLPRRLEERGATVESIVAYRTLEAPATSRELLAAALAQAPAGWIATSGSTVRGLVHLAADVGALDAVRALPVIAIGRVTAAEAERHHLTVVTVAATPDPPGIADAAATLLAIRESRP